MNLSIETSTYTPENFYGKKDCTANEIVVLQSGKVVKGQLVKKDASGKIIPDDGVDVATLYGIMAEDVDATTADKVGVCYINGSFQDSALTYPAGKTLEDYKDVFRTLGFEII